MKLNIEENKVEKSRWPVQFLWHHLLGGTC